MKKRIGILIVLAGVGCSSHSSKHKTVTLEDTQLLQNKYDLYTELIPSVQDEHGFIEEDKCDSLLFSGLLSTTTIEVDIDSAQDPNISGKWYRRPITYPECYSNGLSRSTISKDGILGVLWFAYKHKRLDIVKDLWSYGMSHAWFMGEGRLGGVDTLLNPNMIGLLDKLEVLMGGNTHPLAIYDVKMSDCQGYECHIGALMVLLEAEITNNISNSNLELIKTLHNRNPNNPLFSYIVERFTSDNYDKTIDILLNSPNYPSDRLPTSSDVCEPWPMQREDSELKVCPEENKIHSGGDFLFIASLILDRR